MKLIAEERGYSDAEVARLLGTHPSYISRIFSGKQEPGQEIISRFCRRFGVSPGRLTGEELPTQGEVEAAVGAAIQRLFIVSDSKLQEEIRTFARRVLEKMVESGG
jgi:transcriptional regulator with XRE-family HTH domain